MEEDERWMSIASEFGEGEDHEPQMWGNEFEDIQSLGSLEPLKITEMGFRRAYSKCDARNQYVGEVEEGRVCALPKAYLSRMRKDGDFRMDISSPNTWNQWVYRNVVLLSSNWAVSNITCEDCVFKGGDPEALSNYVRIGLPRIGFERVFKTLETHFPGCLANNKYLKQTARYVWINAAWGVSGYDPASFTIRSSKNHGDKKVYDGLEETSRGLHGKCAEGLMRVQLSIRYLTDEPHKPELAAKCFSFIAEMDDPAPPPRPVKRAKFNSIKRDVGQDEALFLPPAKNEVSLDTDRTHLSASLEITVDGASNSRVTLKRERFSTPVKEEEEGSPSPGVKLEALEPHRSQRSIATNCILIVRCGLGLGCCHMPLRCLLAGSLPALYSCFSTGSLVRLIGHCFAMSSNLFA